MNRNILNMLYVMNHEYVNHEYVNRNILIRVILNNYVNSLSNDAWNNNYVDSLSNKIHINDSY
jgi:hypothetical protein